MSLIPALGRWRQESGEREREREKNIGQREEYKVDKSRSSVKSEVWWREL